MGPKWEKQIILPKWELKRSLLSLVSTSGRGRRKRSGGEWGLRYFCPTIENIGSLSSFVIGTGRAVAKLQVL